MTRLSLWVRYTAVLIKEAPGFMRTWILFGSDGGELQHKMLPLMLMQRWKLPVYTSICLDTAMHTSSSSFLPVIQHFLFSLPSFSSPLIYFLPYFSLIHSTATISLLSSFLPFLPFPDVFFHPCMIHFFLSHFVSLPLHADSVICRGSTAQ